jgi:hypothetical protein
MTAAGMVGAVLLLSGCAATDTSEKPSFPFGQNARDEAIRKQAQSDSLPTAQRAKP